MRLALGFIVSLSVVAAATSCGGGDEKELPDIDCAAVTVPSFAEVAAFDQVCTYCHDSSLTTLEMREDAPLDINFDTYEAASKDPELTAHEVFEGAMPPSDSGLTLTQPQKDQLYAWALCGPQP
jgi:hypothetical protein